MIAAKTMTTCGNQATPALTLRRAAAARLRRLVCASGLSTEEIARRYGLGVRTVQRLIAGKTRMTGHELLCALEADVANDVKEAA